ncbi:hypothetical protein ACFL0Y_00145 [Patescibacteria group bacterium]
MKKTKAAKPEIFLESVEVEDKAEDKLDDQESKEIKVEDRTEDLKVKESELEDKVEDMEVRKDKDGTPKKSLNKLWILWLFLAFVLAFAVGGFSWFLQNKFFGNQSTPIGKESSSISVDYNSELPVGEEPVSHAVEMVKLETQSSSDEIDSIEKDLQATDFSSLDSELIEIEAEISSE